MMMTVIAITNFSLCLFSAFNGNFIFLQGSFDGTAVFYCANWAEGLTVLYRLEEIKSVQKKCVAKLFNPL